jgi:hypothetical protein
MFLCRRPVCIRGDQGWVMRDIVLGNHITLLMEMCILEVLVVWREDCVLTGDRQDNAVYT